MKQHIFAFFLILLSSLCITSEQLDQKIDRSINPLVFQSYKLITVGEIRRGYVISQPGNYTVSSSNIIIRSTDNPAATSTTVGGSAETRGVIKINSRNVHLNLGGAVFETEFSSMSMGSTINTVGVTVADGLDNVTIKNGTFGSGSTTMGMMTTDVNFDSAIIIGQGCSNITIEDITAYGCDGKSLMGMATHEGAIAIKGASSNRVNTVFLKNLVLSNCITSGIVCSYCNDLYLENIQSNSQDFSSMGGMMSGGSIIDINNCKKVYGENIEVNNSLIEGGGTMIDFDTCNDVSLKNLSVTNGDDDSGMSMNNIEGIKINLCKNVFLSQVEASNLVDAEYGLGCIQSTNVKVEYLNISNCTSNANPSDNVAPILIQGSQSVEINHATIANNTMTNDFYGIICEEVTGMSTIISEGIFLNDIEIVNNSATTGMSTSTYTAIDLQDTETVVITNCKIAQNTSTDSFYGIKISNDAQYVTCENVKIINNSAAGDNVSSAQVAGFYCYDADSSTKGLKFINCTASSNSGTLEAYGFYIRSAEYAFFDNCIARGNTAQTFAATSKPSAGLFMQSCNYCTVQNSSFINNKANDYAAASASDQTSNMNFSSDTTIGAGIINLGNNSSTPNVGNSFINCVCNGNGTQLLATSPGTLYYDYGSGNYRYSTTNALAAGAANQWTKFTTYKNCTFNNNGISTFVVGSGLMIAQDFGGAEPSNQTTKTTVENCTANNNTYFGFWDQGASQTTPRNCEMYFIQCLAMTNGAIASSPAAVQYTGAANTHRKNCFVYLIANVATETVPPFKLITFDDVNTDIGTSTSKFINLSVIATP